MMQSRSMLLQHTTADEDSIYAVSSRRPSNALVRSSFQSQTQPQPTVSEDHASRYCPPTQTRFSGTRHDHQVKSQRLSKLRSIPMTSPHRAPTISPLLIIMRHLQPSPLEPTLDIKPLIRLRAIQNRLIATHTLRHIIQSLNNPQSQLLPLLVLRDRNILDMPDQSQIVNTTSPIIVSKPSLP